MFSLWESEYSLTGIILEEYFWLPTCTISSEGLLGAPNTKSYPVPLSSSKPVPKITKQHWILYRHCINSKYSKRDPTGHCQDRQHHNKSIVSSQLALFVLSRSRTLSFSGRCPACVALDENWNSIGWPWNIPKSVQRTLAWGCSGFN